jgi:hypothetical protein
MVGAMSTELITLARTLIGRDVGELTAITFPHPTFTETLEDAVKDAFGRALYNLAGT